ncbi:MAG: hypothetical protein JF586_00575 [Burkholderiales bacterium]|nr:hypothetical protein [Burkholderiales bacterium]
MLTTAFALAAAVPPSFAAHPLQTEDTGTQGTGNLEIENGLSRARSASTTQTIYQPQLSLGLATTLDAIVQPAYVWLHLPQERGSGLGDTNVDAKWRFWDSHPLSLAIRGGVALATNQHGFGLSHGKSSEHALIALTWDRAPTTVHLDVGTTIVPRAAASPARRMMTGVSAAVMQQMDERLILTVDASFGQSPNPHKASWPGTLLAGAIWTLRPGLDLDLGWQRSVDDTPVTRTWLAGLTVRFAL